MNMEPPLEASPKEKFDTLFGLLKDHPLPGALGGAQRSSVERLWLRVESYASYKDLRNPLSILLCFSAAA
jgi:hypothetical protein